jgi:hypothetical protein
MVLLRRESVSENFSHELNRQLPDSPEDKWGVRIVAQTFAKSNSDKSTANSDEGREPDSGQCPEQNSRTTVSDAENSIPEIQDMNHRRQKAKRSR